MLFRSSPRAKSARPAAAAISRAVVETLEERRLLTATNVYSDGSASTGVTASWNADPSTTNYTGTATLTLGNLPQHTALNVSNYIGMNLDWDSGDSSSVTFTFTVNGVSQDEIVTRSSFLGADGITLPNVFSSSSDATISISATGLRSDESFNVVHLWATALEPTVIVDPPSANPAETQFDGTTATQDFVLTRTDDDLSHSLTMGYTLGGDPSTGYATATPGYEYYEYTATGNASGSTGQITFAAGSNTALLTITPQAINNAEGDRSIKVTLNTGDANYDTIPGYHDSASTVLQNTDDGIITVGTPALTVGAVTEIPVSFTDHYGNTPTGTRTVTVQSFDSDYIRPLTSSITLTDGQGVLQVEGISPGTCVTPLVLADAAGNQAAPANPNVSAATVQTYDMSGNPISGIALYDGQQKSFKVRVTDPNQNDATGNPKPLPLLVISAIDDALAPYVQRIGDPPETDANGWATVTVKGVKATPTEEVGTLNLRAFDPDHVPTVSTSPDAQLTTDVEGVSWAVHASSGTVGAGGLVTVTAKATDALTGAVLEGIDVDGAPSGDDSSYLIISPDNTTFHLATSATTDATGTATFYIKQSTVQTPEDTAVPIALSSGDWRSTGDPDNNISITSKQDM